MKLLICGSRSITDYDVVKDAIRGLKLHPTTIIHGGARGVDSNAGVYAHSHGIKEEVYKPDWKVLGRRAGLMRNIQMVHACDEVLAVWDGKSRGTQHTIDFAKSKGKKVHVITQGE